MKKQYINPTTSVMTINTVSMIAASIEIGDPMSGGNAVSREDLGLWEDEDDYDSFFE